MCTILIQCILIYARSAANGGLLCGTGLHILFLPFVSFIMLMVATKQNWEAPGQCATPGVAPTEVPWTPAFGANHPLHSALICFLS